MMPTERDIAQALDLLDWIPLPQVLAIRYEVSRTIRAAPRPGRQGAATLDWDPLERAMLYVLWVTSDEYLERQMPPDTFH